MPFGFLLTLVILTALTLLGLVRLRHHGDVLFRFALPASELPHFALVFLLLSMWLAWDEGSLSGGVGIILLITAIVIVLGLLELLRRALRAAGVIDALITHHGAQPQHGRWTWMRPLLFPFPWRPPSVIRLGPIPYGDNPRQHLDVYRPRDRSISGPVLAYFHGGGYSSGSNRREARALLHHLARRGWTCISATYRLGPDFGFSDHLTDARAVLSWAYSNANVHGGDTSTVVMAGSSAGAHLTALCSLTQDATDPAHPRVDAAISLYAYYGRYFGRGEDEPTASSALALDPSTAPPFFMAHGDYDSFVPVEDARALYRHSSDRSANEVWYAELPGAQHGFDIFASWRLTAVIKGVDAFLEQVITTRRP